MAGVLFDVALLGADLPSEDIQDTLVCSAGVQPVPQPKESFGLKLRNWTGQPVYAVVRLQGVITQEPVQPCYRLEADGPEGEVIIPNLTPAPGVFKILVAFCLKQPEGATLPAADDENVAERRNIEGWDPDEWNSLVEETLRR